MISSEYLAGYLEGYMRKQAQGAGMGEVTVNKDSMYERSPEMEDNKGDYPKYPKRKDWEKKLITLRRKLNFDRPEEPASPVTTDTSSRNNIYKDTP